MPETKKTAKKPIEAPNPKQSLKQADPPLMTLR
jgi:hypothetical protein